MDISDDETVEIIESYATHLSDMMNTIAILNQKLNETTDEQHKESIWKRMINLNVAWQQQMKRATDQELRELEKLQPHNLKCWSISDFRV